MLELLRLGDDVRQLFLLLLVLLANSVYADHEETIVVTNSKAWKPFSFLNQKGEPDGILVDYWRKYGELNKVNVEFLLVDWQASLDAMKSGDADIHAGLLWSESRDRYLEYGPSIMKIDTQLYVHQSLITQDIDEFMRGDHNHRVGVVAGGYEESFTRREFPGLDVVSFANNQLMIDAAFNGQISAFVSDLQVANFYLYSSDEPHRFIGVRHLYSGDLRPAVAEGERDLYNTIISNLKRFSQDDKNQILQRWMYVSTVYPKYLVPLIVFVCTLTALGYIVLLKVTVKRKTVQLEAANRRLKKLSEQDELTGISNRRHFIREFNRAISRGHPLAIIIFDIDDFKQVNDTFGHQIGDCVIQNVAWAARDAISKHCLLGRIGGEEFAVLVFGETSNKARLIAHQICDNVRLVDCCIEGARHVTVSVGCAMYPKTHKGITLSDADHLMYEAKAKGKDCVVSRTIEASTTEQE